MPEDLKKKIQDIYTEAYNKGNVDMLNDLIAPEYVRHQPPMAEVSGLEGFKKFVSDVRSAYTGFGIDVDNVIVSQDTTVVQLTLRGKHTGQAPTLQAPPTGKEIEMKGCLISRWKDGKLVEDWAYNDYLGLQQQFGVIPPPGLY